MDSNKSTWQSLVDTYHTAENFLADMPIAKAIGGVIANPTPQEVGAQVAGLGKAISESAQKATENPVEAAIAFNPIGAVIPKIRGTYYRFNPEGKDLKGINFFSKQKDYAEEYGRIKESKGIKGKIIEIGINPKNPLVVDLPPNKFSDPVVEKKYIDKAISSGNDSVIFRNGDDEFIALIKSEDFLDK